jgi:2-polyprenyl-3-methyl-5-hydroxy-6-metoxy-1,4-benzoquinol methylase
MTCPICNCSSIRKVVTNIQDDFDVFKCNSCSLEFLHPIPNDAYISSLYTAQYYKSWGIEKNENDIVANMKKRTFLKRIKLIQKCCVSGKILDVGTASGFFLEVAKEKGFEPFGVELSEYSSNLAKRKFGNERIFRGTIENAPFPKNYFDCIAMSDLLEHVSDPKQTLSTARNFLKDSGIIMIMTPDTDSFSHKLMGTRWTQYKVEHLFYFNKKSINTLCNMTGFKVVKLTRAWKSMNLAYLNTQFQVYRHPIISPLVRAMNNVLPGLNTLCFNILLGEMVVILKKAL